MPINIHVKFSFPKGKSRFDFVSFFAIAVMRLNRGAIYVKNLVGWKKVSSE